MYPPTNMGGMENYVERLPRKPRCTEQGRWSHAEGDEYRWVAGWMRRGTDETVARAEGAKMARTIHRVLFVMTVKVGNWPVVDNTQYIEF